MYKPVLKYPGSKWGIAKKIISYFPEHHSYLEPYFGSGACLFNKEPSAIETVNDLDNRVYLLFKMVRQQPEKIARMVAETPFCRQEYEQTFNQAPQTDMEIVRQFLVQCWQGHGFRVNGHKVGWKNDVQGREAAYAVNNWNALPQWIMDAAQRLKQVQITNEPAQELIKRFNYPNVLIYADPPYLLKTRRGKQYRHEMTDNEHELLLLLLLQHKGPVVLSGYRSQLYDDYLTNWYSIDMPGRAEGGAIRTETIWMNFKPCEQLEMW